MKDRIMTKWMGGERTRTEWLLFAIVVLQIVTIFVFNFTRMKYCMDYDSICAVTQAAEIWKQKTLILSDWAYQTTLGWDSGVPLVALVYGLTKNLFFSYGLVNCLFVLFYVYVYNRVCNDLNLSKLAKYVVMILLFTPYSLNQLGYAKMLFTAAAYYNVKAILSVMALSILLRIYKDHKAVQPVFCGLFYLFLFASGASTMVYALLCCVVPVILFLVIEVMRKNLLFRDGKWNVSFLLRREFLFVYGAVIASVAGLLFCKLFNLPINPPETNLITVNDFWKNVGSCIAGIYEIFGGLTGGAETPIMSLQGITILICFCIVTLLLGCLIYRVAKMLKQRSAKTETIIIGCFAAVNFLILTLADMTYSGGAFESRYHLLPMLVVFFCTGSVVDEIREKANASVKWLLMTALVSCLLVVNSIGYWNCFHIDNQADELEQILADVRANDIKLLYVLGEEESISEARIMKSLSDDVNVVVTADGVIGMPNGVSTKYFDVSQMTKDVAVLVTSEEQENMPAYVRSRAKCIKTYEYRQYALYLLEENPFDFKAGLPEPGKKKAIDYPYTYGYEIGEASVSETGALVTDGTQSSNYVLWGPNTPAYEGKYTFKIRYKITGPRDGQYPLFDISDGDGEKKWAQAALSADREMIQIKNVEIAEGGEIQLRLYVPEGVAMELYGIEIKRK